MSAPIIAFGNQRLGTGTTTLVYHLAWMLADLNVPVLVVDLDPQSDLTRAFVDMSLRPADWQPEVSFVRDLEHHSSDSSTHPLQISDDLSLLVADLSLGRLENSHMHKGSLSAIREVITSAAEYQKASIVLADLGANVGAVNRAALMASDFFVASVAQDPLSMAGMSNSVEALQEWRAGSGLPRPLGYVVRRHPRRLSEVPGDAGWTSRIPRIFAKLTNEPPPGDASTNDDPWCLGILKHYHSLMPMAQEARKPMFHLNVADGATGAHLQAALEAHQQFSGLTQEVAKRAGLKIPQFSRSIA